MKLDLRNATADQLAALLSSEAITVSWTPTDEERIWQQLLSSSIIIELEAIGIGSQLLGDACVEAKPAIRSFGDLIGHSHPPTNVLNAVRRLAKAQALEASASGIAPMARALYYAVVATAFLADMKITKLAEDGLLGGLAWMRDQPWVDAKTRKVADQARKKFLA